MTPSRNAQVGASLIEYALLVALIAVVAIASIKALSASTAEKFCEAAYSVEFGSTENVSPQAYWNADRGVCVQSYDDEQCRRLEVLGIQCPAR